MLHDYDHCRSANSQAEAEYIPILSPTPFPLPLLPPFSIYLCVHKPNPCREEAVVSFGGEDHLLGSSRIGR